MGASAQWGRRMKNWLSFRVALASSLTALLLAFAQPAQAEKRVALVIGNNDYKNVPKLQKAVNDARTMGETLKQLGFSVMVAENQSGRLSAKPCSLSTRPSSPAIPYSSMQAMALRSQARTSCCRPMCLRRPKARKNWCATLPSLRTESSSGCRTRRRVPQSSYSMPAATTRSNGRATLRSQEAAVWRR